MRFKTFKTRFTVEAIFNRLSHIKCAKFYMGYVAYPMLFVVGMYAECLNPYYLLLDMLQREDMICIHGRVLEVKNRWRFTGPWLSNVVNLPSSIY